jgi:hypothetical protein
MRFLALIGCVIMVILTTYLIVKKTDPHLFLKLQITFNVLGNNDDVKAEKNRLENIDLLPIADEKKSILANHTIFLGATKTMVRLALGDPLQEHADADKNISYWDYHLDEDIKATRLMFNQDTLVSAEAVGY